MKGSGQGMMMDAKKMMMEGYDQMKAGKQQMDMDMKKGAK